MTSDTNRETIRIFVSYAREDKRWLEKDNEHNIIPWLFESLKKQNVVFWYDENLVPSELYTIRIKEEIDKADIAILVVSQPFLNSDYIEKNEFPWIKEHAEKRRLPVIPVLVEPCLWEENDFLSDRQMLPGKPTPLINYTERAAEWAKVKFELLEGIKKLVTKIRSERMQDLHYQARTPIVVEEIIPTSDGGQPVSHQEPKIKPALKNTKRKRYIRLTKTIVAIFVVCIVAIGIVYFMPGHQIQIDQEFEKTRDSLYGAMPWVNWIVYDPSEYDPYNEAMPSEESIQKDLEVLIKHGFNGLIMVNSKGSCGEIARVGRQLGFVKIIVGVWDIRDDAEMGNALAAAMWADAYCLGHRGSNGQRYPLHELKTAITQFRTQTHRPVTTSEVLATYETNPVYVAIGDFLFPDVHTYWHEGQTPTAAWQQTVESALKAEGLVAKESESSGNPKKQVLLKMISFPSDGADGLTESSQKEFYRKAIQESPMKGDLPVGISMAFFSAFDEPWKTVDRGFAAPELSTGLFHVDREPKPAVTQLDWSRKNR